MSPRTAVAGFTAMGLGLVIAILSLVLFWQFRQLPPPSLPHDIQITVALLGVTSILFAATVTVVAIRTRQFTRKRKEFEAALRRQNEYFAGLHETTLALIDRLELNTLLDSIVTRAGSLIGTPHGYIDLVLPDHSALEQKVGRGIFGDFVGYRVQHGEGLGGEVWRTGELLVVDDYTSWPHRIAAFTDCVHAVVGAPLKSGRQVIGVIGLAYAEPGLRFGPEQIEVLSQFAELASVALDNARLYTAAQEELAERRRAGELRNAIYRIAQAASEAGSLNELFRTVHGIIQTIMPADNFYIALYDEDENLLSFPYFVDEIDAPPPPRTPGNGLTEYVLRTAKPLLAASAKQEELSRAGAAVPVGVPSSNWLGVPLIIDRKAIGVMAVQHYSDPDAYSENDLHVLEFVSSEAARAIGLTRAQEAIQRERNFAQQVMNTQGQGLSVTGPDRRFEYINLAFAKLIGCTPEEVIGLQPENIVWPDDVEIMAAHRQRRWSGETTTYEMRLRHKDGRPVPVLVTGTPRRENNQVAGAITVITDLTDRKQAEEALRKSEQRFRTLAENIPGVIYQCRNDERFTMLYLNDAVEALTGYPKEDFLEGRRSINDLDQPEDAATIDFHGIVNEALANRRQFHMLYRLRHKSGEWKWVEEWGTGVYADDGSLLFIEGFLSDITERKQAEESLRKSEERFRALAENIPGAIYQCKNDDRYTFLYLNDEVEALTGYPKEAFLEGGLSFFELYHPDDAMWMPVPSKANPVEIWQPFHFTYRIRHKSGEWRWVEEWGAGVFAKDGVPQFLEGVMIDITERKRAEAQIERSALEMAALSHMGQVVAATLELHIVLKKVIDEVSPLLHAEGISILLPEAPNKLVFAAASGPASAGLVGRRIPQMAGAAGGVMQTGQTVRVTSGASEPQLYRQVAPGSEYHTRSLLAVPLNLGGEVIGVMEAVHTAPEAFSLDDQRLLEAAANWAALAIGNAHQHERIQRRLRESEAMAAISRALNETLDLQLILQLIVDSAMRLIPSATRAMIHMFDEAQQALAPVAASGERQLDDSEVALKPGEGIGGRVFSEGILINVSDTAAIPEFVPSPAGPALVSLLVVPVESGAQRLGILNVDSSEPGAFSADDERLLTNLGVQAALAIENARLFEAASRRADELNAASEILRILNAASNITHTFPSIATGLKAITGCERVSLAMLDDNAEWLTIVALDQYRPELGAGTRVPAKYTSAIGADILEGRIHLTPDLSLEVDAPVERVMFDAGYRSRINLPLRAGERIIGSLDLNWLKTNAYNPGQLLLLEQIADALALAVEKNRLFNEATESLTREQRLNEIVRAISGALDPSSILRNITRLAAELVSADAASLALLDDTRQNIDSVHVYNFSNFVAATPLPRGQGVAWQIIETGNSLLLADYPSHPNALPEWVEAGACAFLGVPIGVGQDRFGALGLFNMTPDRTFTVRDVSLAESVGLQAGVAIQNARLFEALHKRAAELATVAQVSIDAATNLNPAELLQNVVDLTRSSFHLYHAHIYLLNEAGDMLALTAGSDEVGRKLVAAGHRIALAQEQSVVARAARTRQAIIVNDVSRETLFLPNPLLPHTQSELAVPMVVSDKLLGVFDVQADSVNHFTEEDVRIQSTLTAQVAVALQNAQLFEALSEEKRRIELLYTISQGLTATLDPREVASRAIQLTTTAIGADVGHISVLQPGADRLHLLAISGYGSQAVEEINRRIELRLDNSFTGEVAVARTPMVTPEAGRAPRWAHIPEIDDGIDSAAGLPLLAGDRLVGVLILLSRQRDFFKDRHLPTLAAVAAQVAVAMQNARLYEAERRRVEMLTGLHETSIELSTQFDLSALLHSIVERAARLLDAPLGDFCMALPDGQTFEVTVGYNLPDKFIGARLKLGEGAAGRAAQTGEPVIVGDYDTWPGRAEAFEGGPFKSVLSIPVLWRGDVIGVISVEDVKPGRFSRADAEFVDLFADQAAVAIANARQHAELQRRLQESDALAAISRTFNETLDLDRVLLLIVEAARRIIPSVDRAVIHLFDPDGRTLRPAAVTGTGDAAQSHIIMRPGEGIAGQVIAKGTVINVADTHADSRYLISERASRTRSLLVAPVQSGPHQLGTLSVNSSKPHAFSADDERLLGTLGVQAALAIYNAQLFEDTRRQLDELLLLHTVAIAGAEATSEDELIERASRLVGETLNSVNFGVMLLDEGGRHLRAHSSYHDSPGSPIPVGLGVTGRVAGAGQPWLVQDVSEEPAYINVDPRTRSELCVPLKAGNLVLGVINAESDRVNGFTETDQRLLATLAGQLATAIQKLRLYSELEQALRQEKAARTQLVQSEKLAAMGRLVASVAHELNNPLQAIQNALYLVRQEPTLGLQSMEDLQVASTEADRMAGLISRLRETYRPATSEEFRLESLNAIVNDVQKLIATHLRHNHIEFKFDPDPSLPLVPGIRDQLKQVMLNLCLNAVEAMPNGGTLTIASQHQPASSGVLLSIRDTGSGIAPEALGSVFDPFFTTKETGTGLGLTITYDIVQRHKGRIEVASEPGQGTAFTIWLPVEIESEFT